jgi:hypothetical protein
LQSWRDESTGLDRVRGLSVFALAPRQSVEMLRRGPHRWILAYAFVEMTLPFPLIAVVA